MKEKPNILIADCESEEVRAFAETFRVDSKGFAVRSHVANKRRSGSFSELVRYLKYFGVALRYFIGRKNYGVIAGWQQFYALIFCFYCSLFHVRKSNTVIALNFTYKEKRGFAGKLYRRFMERCVVSGYLDYLHVTSRRYAEKFCREFGFPEDRVMVIPFGIDDRYEELRGLAVPSGFKKNGYALAIGRSNRDYGFLIDAWQGIDLPLVIISDTYKGTAGSGNITILSGVAGDESSPWIVNCGIMVIPIDDGLLCSGDTVLLTAMSLERKIIVVPAGALSDTYITNGVNGIVVPKDKELLAETVAKITHSDEYADLGQNARREFMNGFTRRMMGQRITDFLIWRREGDGNE